MAIDGRTNIANLLDEYPELSEVFVRISPHFKKLENKFLRKTIARRVTLADAARVAGVDLEVLVSSLNAEIGEGRDVNAFLGENDRAIDWSEVYSQEFEYKDSQIEMTLDVREDIASNRDPLAKIMRTAKSVEVGKILVVINTFEPIPLYDVLGKKGFVHMTAFDGEIFKIFFKRISSPGNIDDRIEKDGDTKCPADENEVIEIDVRGLEPPEPMMRILEILKDIDRNTTLLVHHHREPLFLYDKLAEKGFEAVSNMVEKNHYKIVIRPKERR